MLWRSKTVPFLAVLLLLGVAPWPTARGDDLTLVKMLEVDADVDDVNGLGGLTWKDSSLWMGYAWWAYYYYHQPGLESETAWVGRVNPADGTVEQAYAIPGSDWPYAPMTGLASDGTNLQATLRSDGLTGIAQFVPPAPPHAVFSFQGPEPHLRTTGLAHDGSFLWQGHYSPEVGHLYAIDPVSGQRVNDLAVDPYPFGLASDGRYLYVAHHDVGNSTSYVAQYDRSGAKVATYGLPAPLANAPLGDLAINGQDLYAHVLGSNQIAHLEVPPQVQAPLPPGVTRQATTAEATIVYDWTVLSDCQEAANPAQLPIAASLRRVMTTSEVDLLGRSRSYYDADGFHNKTHALAYGADHDSPLDANSELTVSKTILISPGPGLPAGMDVWATGRLTLNGTLQACRNFQEVEGAPPNGDGLPDPTGLTAGFEVRIVKTAPGPDNTVFFGTISLIGQDATAWVRLVQLGDLAGAIDDGLALTDEFACVAMEDIEVRFRVPAIVGQPFDIDVAFRGYALLPQGAQGLGAEVAFGEDPLLTPGYHPYMDVGSYDDDFPGGWTWQTEYYVPEPCAALLLAAGAVAIGRRRRAAG